MMIEARPVWPTAAQRHCQILRIPFLCLLTLCIAGCQTTDLESIQPIGSSLNAPGITPITSSIKATPLEPPKKAVQP